MSKITVKKEGRDNIFLVEKEEIIRWIKGKGFETLHNFTTWSAVIIGADHDIDSVINDIINSERIGILIESAALNNMGHSLAVIVKDELKPFDIGVITEKDLNIIE